MLGELRDDTGDCVGLPFKLDTLIGGGGARTRGTRR